MGKIIIIREKENGVQWITEIQTVSRFEYEENFETGMGQVLAFFPLAVNGNRKVWHRFIESDKDKKEYLSKL